MELEVSSTDSHEKKQTNYHLYRVPTETHRKKTLSFAEGFSLDLQQESHAAQCPLGGLLLGPEVEGPDEGGSSRLGLVNGAVVDIPQVLAVHGDGLDKDDRHGWSQFLEAGLGDHAGLHVPPRT